MTARMHITGPGGRLLMEAEYSQSLREFVSLALDDEAVELLFSMLAAAGGCVEAELVRKGRVKSEKGKVKSGAAVEADHGHCVSHDAGAGEVWSGAFPSAACDPSSPRPTERCGDCVSFFHQGTGHGQFLHERGRVGMLSESDSCRHFRRKEALP